MSDTVTFSDEAMAFASAPSRGAAHDYGLAQMYDELAARMTSPEAALRVILEVASDPDSMERHREARLRFQAALHFAAVRFDGADIADADWNFGWGMR